MLGASVKHAWYLISDWNDDASITIEHLSTSIEIMTPNSYATTELTSRMRMQRTSERIRRTR